MVRLLRGTLLLAGCLLAVRGSWTLAAPSLRAVDPRSAESLLLAGSAAVLLGCVGWLVAVTTLTLTSYVVGAMAPGSPAAGSVGRLVERGCPALLARGVAACLGAAVTAGVATPALADAGPGLDGLALPDRQPGSGLASAGRTTVVLAARPAGEVVVRPGDSLWAITSRLLPPGATDEAVSVGWRRLHLANRDRVGPDPDLIQPGTPLRVPDLAPPRKDPQ